MEKKLVHTKLELFTMTNHLQKMQNIANNSQQLLKAQSIISSVKQ